MVFVFLCLDDVHILSDVVVVRSVIHCSSLTLQSRLCSSLNGEKVIYDSSRRVKQQFTYRRMRFYLANFEQNILFGPFQLYELSSDCEI